MNTLYFDCNPYLRPATQTVGPSAPATRLAWFRNGWLKFLALVYFAFLTIIAAAPNAHAQGSTPYQSVRSYLDDQKNGTGVLLFLHAGADYHGHKLLRETAVTDRYGDIIPGQSALVYRYYWADDGITDLAFFCDVRGNIVGTKVVYTNAQFQQPFLMANLGILTLGHAVIDSDDKMTAEDRKLALKFIDNADAQSLLNLVLRLR